MSEQNQLAISPVAAGLTGAAIGASNYWLGIGAKPAEGYRNTKELLTLEKDKFEALAKTVAEKGDDAAKAEFKKLEDGRVTVSKAGDTLIKEQADAKIKLVDAVEKSGKATAATEKTAMETAVTARETARKQLGGLNVTTTGDDTTGYTSKVTHASEYNTDIKTKRDELRTARENARKAITDKTDDGLGKELKTAQDELAAAGTDKDKTAAAQKKIDEVNKKIAAEVTKNEDVKKAKEALNTERKKIITDDVKKSNSDVIAKKDAYRNKLVENLENVDEYKNATANKDAADGTIEKLKHTVEEYKAKLAEKVDDVKAKAADDLVGDKGALKDLDTGKFSKFLKKAKTMPTLIAAGIMGAAGVALAYIVGPKNATPKDVA